MNLTQQEMAVLAKLAGMAPQGALATQRAQQAPANCPPGVPPAMWARTPPQVRQAWAQYAGGFGVPMATPPATGPVPAPDYLQDACYTPGPGHAPFGRKVPIFFQKSIAAGTADTVEIKPNQVGVPVGLDMTTSGDSIIVTDIRNYNNASMYDQGDGDILVAAVANIDYNNETFESDANPFPATSDRINRTYPIKIDVANSNLVDPELAKGILWLRVE